MGWCGVEVLEKKNGCIVGVSCIQTCKAVAGRSCCFEVPVPQTFIAY
jgi:hypothetical protein